MAQQGNCLPVVNNQKSEADEQSSTLGTAQKKLLLHAILVSDEE